MNLLDEHLLALYKKGICKYQDVIARVQAPEEFDAQARTFGLEDGPPPLAPGASGQPGKPSAH
jgi:hypothetical protein